MVAIHAHECFEDAKSDGFRKDSVLHEGTYTGYYVNERYKQTHKAT